MNPYKLLKTKEPHSIKEIFENFKVQNEKQFCRAWLTIEEATNFFSNSGFELPDKISEIKFDDSLKFGDGVLFPDVLIFFENDDVWYMEVMSTSNNGKWDNEHHKQFYIKKFRLSQMHPNLYSFAISFKPFDPCFSEEICDMENTFGVELIFNQDGYTSNVICKKEEQKKISSERDEKLLEFWTILQPKLKFPLSKPGKWDYVEKCVGDVRLGIKSNTKSFYTYMNFKDETLGLYKSLVENKEKIEEKYNCSLTLLENRVYSHIQITSDPCIDDKANWPDATSFINKSLEILSKIAKEEFSINFDTKK